MRNLYRALGFQGIVTDLAALERALDQGVPSEARVAQARFVLLDPVRKAQYDQVLACTLDLSEARSRLGLPRDPFPSGQMPVAPSSRGYRSSLWRVQRVRWAGWVGAIGLLLVGTRVWLPSRTDSRPPTSLSEATAAGRPTSQRSPTPPLSSPAVPPDGPAALPPPEHGWLQMGPEVHPLVPWQIETDPGQDYVLSLLDASTQAVVLTVYLRGGEPYRGLAPEGAFDLTYTVGPHWLGPERGYKDGSSTVRPVQTYLVLAGPDETWAWRLRLHPTGSEGSVVAPVAPSSTPPAPPNPRLVPAATP